jgi:hypothetical protein
MASRVCSPRPQTLLGQPVAWVNNQFRQYVYDVSNILSSSSPGNTNLTVAFESAWFYGLNVTSRPDAETFPNTDTVVTSDDVSHFYTWNVDMILTSCSMNTPVFANGYGRRHPTLDGIGYAFLGS